MSYQKWKQKNINRFNENQRKYRETNRDSIAAYKKDWKKRNAKRLSAKSAQYRCKNKDAIALTKSEWAKNNRNKVRARQTVWRLKNKESEKQRIKEWALKNPIKMRAASHRRRARKKSNSTCEQIESATAKIRTMMGFKKTACAYCGRIFLTKKMHIDHINPLANGGAHSAENICMACPSCNSSKSARIVGHDWIPPQLCLL